MKNAIIVTAGIVTVSFLFAFAGAIVFRPDEQLKQLNRIEQQLKDIKRDGDELEKTLNGIMKQSKVETEIPKTTGKIITGEASIYTENGCLGCDKNLIMANGERLDDTRATIALLCRYHQGRCRLDFDLNTDVRVVNAITGQGVVARVTDTGGFAKYGRVADLSLATANAIGCDGLCQVKIY